MALAPLPLGPAVFYSPATPSNLEVFSYKPLNYDPATSHLLVVLHGAQRNAADYRDAAKALADRTSALVVAPRFDSDTYSLWRYRTGGAFVRHKHHGSRPEEEGGGGGPHAMSLVRADESALALVLYSVIAQVRALESSPSMPYHFFAHSAGAQMLHRVLLFRPDPDMASVVIANAGSYTLPDANTDFPYGLRGLPPDLVAPGGSMTGLLRSFVESHINLALGTKDVSTDEPSLDKSEEAMKQGLNRTARAKTAFEAYRQLANDNGWQFGWRFVPVEGVGHDGEKMLKAAAVGEALALGAADKS